MRPMRVQQTLPLPPRRRRRAAARQRPTHGQPWLWSPFQPGFV